MSYAQPADIMARYDSRRLGDLVGDSGTRVTAALLGTDPNLQVALDDAAGMLDAAIQRGQRYTILDLTNIMGATPPPAGQPGQTGTPSQLWTSKQLLIRLNCDLAYGLLIARRGLSSTDNAAMAPRYTEALRILEQLSSGGLIFVTTPAIGAGLPVPAVTISQDINLLSGITRLFGDLTNGNPNS